MSSPSAATDQQKLPSGLVTFVMTDIEGSTQLFNRLGDDYLDVLATHNVLLRDAFTRHGGAEVGTEGDSLFVAFSDAAAAVAACLESQRKMATARWPPGVEVRVRMGVHTGQATPVGRDYVSLAVHQVARISAGAHGGQVVVSQATAAAVEGRLPTGASLTALGSFQLRGFSAPIPLLQLRHPDLRAGFPPLRTPGVVAHNLPFLRASFVGREQERAALTRLLAGTGIVTVVGPGGVGKTRLAVQVAFDVLDRFADGAWLVELASTSDPAAVPRAVASALGQGEVSGGSVVDSLVDTLRAKSLLLVLDNCEHVLEAASALAEQLLQHCPSLVVLATSREPLEIDGEAVWRLDPLPTADPSDAADNDLLAATDAVQLFVTRASLVRPDFALTDQNTGTVARVVARLNGLPLAIELAAAALGDHTLDGVLDGLSDRFALLTRGRRTAAPRHHTLRAALEWSLDLLAPDERRLFVRLAAFTGAGTTQAASAVCAGDPVDAERIPSMLRRLARRSLLEAASEQPERWTMLESLRELAALELTELGESADLARRHGAWFAQRVDMLSGQLGRSGQASVLAEIEADHDNVRRALDRAVTAAEVTTALRLATAMGPFWTSHGDWSEGAERLSGALELPGGDLGQRARAQAALGSLQLLEGDLDAAASTFASARVAAVSLGDDVTMARALVGSGYVAFRHSDLAGARSAWEQGLQRAERSGEESVAAGALRGLAIAAGSAGDQQKAEGLLERAIAAAKQAGDEQQLRLLLGSAAEVQLWLGHLDRARDMYEQALALAAAIGDASARPLLVAELGWVSLLEGEPEPAYRRGVEAAELAEDLHSPRVLAHALRLTGEALARQGLSKEPEAALERAMEVARRLGAAAEVAGVRCSQACLALDRRDYDRAQDLASEAVGLSSLRHAMRRVDPEWVLATVSLRLGRIAEAGRRFSAAAAEAERLGSPRHLANHLAGQADVRLAAGDPREAGLEHGRAAHLRLEMGDRLGVASSLEGLAAAAASGQPTAAARLLATAARLRTQLGAVTSPDEQEIVDATVASIGVPTAGATAVEDAAVPTLVDEVVGVLTDNGGDSRGETTSPQVDT